ncbi:MAG: PilZ domain-containing protein [Candidatus Omnitrophica bacterium]|jgi:hypothetical protein|nr:PilZ domain-containing protein [Candidatus Omnitrophota bacterium]
MTHKSEALNRRQYVRLDSVFPVGFRLFKKDANCFLSGWVQGFTSNVGKGGICLEARKINPEIARLLNDPSVALEIELLMPLGSSAIRAKAEVIWVSRGQSEDEYVIGLKYASILESQRRKIIRYAWGKKIFTPLVLSLVAILAVGLLVNSYLHLRLIRQNRQLIEQLVVSRKEVERIQSTLEKITGEKASLQENLKALEEKLNNTTEAKSRLLPESIHEAQSLVKLREANLLIAQINKERAFLKEKLSELSNTQAQAAEQLTSVEKTRLRLERANVDKMYEWIKVHQSPRTGLVMSFEGDKDFASWAFTYDQALSALAFTYFGDYARSRKIFDFYLNKAEKLRWGFLNGYYFNDGAAAEYTVHSGPNLWVGIAIAQYTRRTNDTSYLPLAEKIADFIISLQSEDQDSGIRGGPDVKWFSTEHNLDAYAFLNMLYILTGKNKYLVARDGVLEWLKKHTYDQYDVPINRGKGDSTIATDTYAWSVAALGPEKLIAIGMDPVDIMDFADKNCAVEVDYMRPEAVKVRVKGFDFAAQRHVARPAVVSSEWTSQMILSFKIMADFLSRTGQTKKALDYKQKAQDYLASLSGMIISSPSASGQGQGCLPYASEDFVDTGHGWTTPKGKSTGSLAGTAYTIFAYYNFNPLNFE